MKYPSIEIVSFSSYGLERTGCKGGKVPGFLSTFLMNGNGTLTQPSPLKGEGVKPEISH
jgi:hypothetical protein